MNRRLVTLAIVALTALGAWLRFKHLYLPITSDEMGLVQPLSFLGILLEEETGVNPPLHRLVFNLLMPSIDATIMGGRIVSLICSVASIPMAFVLGKRVAANPVAGLIVAGTFAFAPNAVTQSAMFRSYSLWLLITLWHLLAATRYLTAPEGKQKGPAIALVISALLMPQLHYISIPILLGEGFALLFLFPKHRRGFSLFIPAGALIVPFLFIIPVMTGRRIPPENFSHGVGILIGMFLVPVMLVVVVTAFHVWNWKKNSLPLRFLTVGTIIMIFASLFAAGQQYIRTASGLFMMPFFIPIFASAVESLSDLAKERVKVLAAASLQLLLRGASYGLIAYVLTKAILFGYNDPSINNVDLGWPRFLSDVQQLSDVPNQLYLTDSPHELPTIYFKLTGDSIMKSRPSALCKDRLMCFSHEGRVFAGYRAEDSPNTPAVHVILNCLTTPQVPAECILLRDEQCYKVWRCPASE